MAFLTVIGLIFVIALIVNIRQDKSNSEYHEYIVDNGYGHYVEDEEGNKSVVIYATKD